MAIETLRRRFPMAQFAADIADEVVTLNSRAPDVNIKRQITAAFNQPVTTMNTIDQIALGKPGAASTRGGAHWQRYGSTAHLAGRPSIGTLDGGSSSTFAAFRQPSSRTRSAHESNLQSSATRKDE